MIPAVFRAKGVLFLLTWCVWVLFPPALSPARQLSRPALLSAYLYNFAKNITWPDEGPRSSLEIRIVSADSGLRREAANLARQTVRGKTLRVRISSELPECVTDQLIFVARDKKELVPAIHDRIEGNAVLLVTEEFDDRQMIMINFSKTRDQQIHFQINRANIINQGLTILPDMVLLGGTEVDVARIYRKAQQDLRHLRSEVRKLQEQQRHLLGEVAASKERLRGQQEEFSRQQTKLQALLDQVEKRKQELREQLLKGTREIARQKEQLQRQERLLAQGQVLLARQNEKLQAQQREIEAKAQLSRQRANLIERQRKLLYLLVGSLVFIALLALLVFEGYREKRKANRLLARAKEKADRANMAKTRFLAHVSHELRTPLNAILGFTRLLARNRNLPGQVADKVEVIEKSGRHLLRLINDILDMSKIESGPMALNPQPVDLQTLLGDVTEIIRARAGEKSLRFDVELDERLPPCVRIDGQKLTQVLLNLLGNSVKFTRNGGLSMQVSLSPEQGRFREGEQVALMFRIRDTGIGISASALERIFEPFVQQKTEAAGEGTGLGLAISRHLVRLMGGDITVSSTLGKGTEFSFTVAATVAPSAAVRPARKGGHVIGLAGGAGQYRIMVAEDNEPSRKLLELMLVPVGFAVFHVSNGRDAVERYRTERPDLILMDIRMPEMDGLEATRRIRHIEREQGGHVPIIALTAHAFEEERRNILKGGCDDFIRKPFSDHEIFEVIGRHLDLEYQYEEQDGTGREKMVLDDAFVQAVCRLPRELSRGLHEAVQRLDVEAMEKMTEQIRSRDAPLADTLGQLLGNYQYEQLVEVLASCEDLDD